MTSVSRIVVRSRRFQLIGIVSMLLAAGAFVLIYIVIAAPSRSFEHPSGFTSGSRVLTVAGCALVALTLTAFGVSGLRVALILDKTGMVIRNPWRTTTVGWDASPKFDIRGREQDVTISSPITTTSARPQGSVTYRYREIVCIANRQRIWIAATSRMRHRDRVDHMLIELRKASGQFRNTSAAHADSTD